MRAAVSADGRLRVGNELAGGISEADFKKYFAEAIGTFFLTMGGMLSIVGAGDMVGIAAASGAILGVMIYVFGPISGGHFNPAISTALFIQKKLAARDYMFYLVFQVVGATIGAMMAVAVVPLAPWGTSAQAGATLGLLTRDPIPPTYTFNPGGALILEILMTFMLATTYSMVVAGREKMAPLSGALIGGTLFACILWGGPWTGGSMNPARSLGPAFVSGTNQVIWASMWLYIVGPLIGGALAAFGFMWFRGDLKIHLSVGSSAPAAPPPPPLPPPPSQGGLPAPPTQPPLPAPIMSPSNQDQPRSGI